MLEVLLKEQIQAAGSHQLHARSEGRACFASTRVNSTRRNQQWQKYQVGVFTWIFSTILTKVILQSDCRPVQLSDSEYIYTSPLPEQEHLTHH